MACWENEGLHPLVSGDVYQPIIQLGILKPTKHKVCSLCLRSSLSPCLSALFLSQHFLLMVSANFGSPGATIACILFKVRWMPWWNVARYPIICVWRQFIRLCRRPEGTGLIKTLHVRKHSRYENPSEIKLWLKWLIKGGPNVMCYHLG